MTPNLRSEDHASLPERTVHGCGPESGCRLEAILSVDERGQLLLPKDVRQKAGIAPGDKLALIGWERDGSICCLALLKAEELNGVVEGVLGPKLRGDETA